MACLIESRRSSLERVSWPHLPDQYIFFILLGNKTTMPTVCPLILKRILGIYDQFYLLGFIMRLDKFALP